MTWRGAMGEGHWNVQLTNVAKGGGRKTNERGPWGSPGCACCTGPKLAAAQEWGDTGSRGPGKVGGTILIQREEMTHGRERIGKERSTVTQKNYEEEE